MSEENLSDRQKLTNRFNSVDQRAIDLYQKAHHPDKHSSDFLEYLSALSNALEELRVAEEELCEQNEELFQARYELEIQQRRYQDLFEFAPDAYLITDKNGIIQEANRAAAELFKVNQKYLIRKPLVSFVHLDQQRTFRSLLLQLLSVDRVQEWEMSFVDYKYQQFEVALTVVAVKEAEETCMLRWIVRDITARKQVEEQLRQIQHQNLALVEADRLKQQFIATISHELRTPLTAILGFSNLLLRQFHQQFPPHQFQLIERIFENGRHLLALIEDVLDFSKLKSQQIELQREAFDLIELVTSTIAELRSLAERKNITLDFQSTMSNLTIVNDRSRVKQILVNLISNAIKFTEVGSVSVQVRSGRWQSAALVVQDTGIGIAEADLNAIFQEFRQVNQTSTRQHGGTGLGLAITKALVQLMNGEISVQSQLEVGSTFTVELPTHPAFR